MTINLKSNLNVGPVNIFRKFDLAIIYTTYSIAACFDTVYLYTTVRNIRNVIY